MVDRIDYERMGIPKNLLDVKKEQTKYKTKYVSTYVQNWLYVMVKENRFTNINFIDCMCNAGVYEDGDPCTSILVLDLFIINARKYPQKIFNLYFNDISHQRIESTQKVIKYLYPNLNNLLNLNIDYKIMDVNDYLKNQSYNSSFKNNATILYVDPYDFGTVQIPNIVNFLKYNYSEVLFNVITSDFVRNGIDDRIRKCIDCSNITNKDELIMEISKQLKVSKVNYSFSYQFKNQNKSEIYQIFYATPHIEGLIKLKDALWEVFKGKKFHRNQPETIYVQECLFDEEDDKEYFESIYSSEAKKLLLKTYCSKTVSYNDIEMLLLEKTMLRKGQILDKVIHPLIAEKKIYKLNSVIKNGKVIKNNYTEDKYEIIGD